MADGPFCDGKWYANGFTHWCIKRKGHDGACWCCDEVDGYPGGDLSKAGMGGLPMPDPANEPLFTSAPMRHPVTGRFMAGDCERDCLEHCAGLCGAFGTDGTDDDTE